MNKRHQFRDGEKHLSQIPALHLLQTMAPKWVMLSKVEVDRERRGKLSNVLLEDIIRAQLMRLNAIEVRGKQYPFSESNIQTAIERLRSREFYHAMEKHLGAINTPGKDVRADAAEAAETMLNIISRRRVVNWTQRDDIQNEMRNDLDDYLFDVMRDGKGHPLTPDLMDEIIDRILSIARARLPD